MRCTFALLARPLMSSPTATILPFSNSTCPPRITSPDAVYTSPPTSRIGCRCGGAGISSEAMAMLHSVVMIRLVRTAFMMSLFRFNNPQSAIRNRESLMPMLRMSAEDVFVRPKLAATLRAVALRAVRHLIAAGEDALHQRDAHLAHLRSRLSILFAIEILASIDPRLLHARHCAQRRAVPDDDVGVF